MAAVWIALLAGVAVPQWRHVQRQHGEIARIEQRLADLDRWNVAGMWLAPAVAAREPQVQASWRRLFPHERDREELFLSLAAVADQCGVEDFALEEVGSTGMPGGGATIAGPPTDAPLAGVSAMDGPAMDGPATDGPPTDGPPTDGPALAGAAAAPTITLDRYRVRARFRADYARTAAFVGRLHAVSRAIDVYHLAIRPARTGLDVEMELQVYVSPQDAS